MNFNQLTKRLPSLQEQPEIVMNQDKALTTTPARLQGFVAPTLDVVDWPDGATVLLVEAAGAVGKTTAAEALAEELNWPLVLAQYARVGSYTLSGLIQDALGFNGSYIDSTGRIYKPLRAGKRGWLWTLSMRHCSVSA